MPAKLGHQVHVSGLYGQTDRGPGPAAQQQPRVAVQPAVQQGAELDRVPRPDCLQQGGVQVPTRDPNLVTALYKEMQLLLTILVSQLTVDCVLLRLSPFWLSLAQQITSLLRWFAPKKYPKDEFDGPI